MKSSSSSHNKFMRSNAPKHWSENGNETDASGSTETLTVEEQHAMWHMQRQEPQGQEQNHATQSTVITVGGSDLGQAAALDRNNDSNLSFGSSTNTLIIHHSVPDESWSNRWLAGYTSNNMSQNSGSSVHNSYSDPSKNAYTSSLYLRGNSNQLQDPSMDLHNRNPKMNISSTDLKEIPNSYLDRSEILKHLVAKDQNKYKDVGRAVGRSQPKEVVNSLGSSSGTSDRSASSSSSCLNALAGDSATAMPKISPQYPSPSLRTNRMPPPYFSHFQQEKYGNPEADFFPDGRRSVDKNTSTLSKSQPDLSNVGISKELTPMKDLRLHPLYSEDETNNSLKEMVDILNSENHSLKLEIDYLHRKVNKLQKFEADMLKVEEQHEVLVKMGERREQLERLARHKLHSEVRRLAELNADLNLEVRRLLDSNAELREQSVTEVKSHAEGAIHRSSSLRDDSSELASLRKELTRKDTIVAQLVSQNRELSTTKGEIEKDVMARDKKTREQQKQIDILDSALTSTQTTVLKLEDEVKKNQNAVEQTDQLRKLLFSMQRASTRLDQSEKSMKQKLEDEIVMLRSKNKLDTATSQTLDILAELRNKDEKISFLESELSKVKQRFMLDTYKNQMDSDLLGNSKEYTLDTSQHEKERRMSQTKLDHIRYSDEYKNLSKRMEELELCNRSLEAVIVERESKIKALNMKAEESISMGQLNQSSAALNLSGREDNYAHLRREPSLGPGTRSRNSIPRKDEELDEISSVLSLLANLSLVAEDNREIATAERLLQSQELAPASKDAYNSLEKFCAKPQNKTFLMNFLESKDRAEFSPNTTLSSSEMSVDPQTAPQTYKEEEVVTTADNGTVATTSKSAEEASTVGGSTIDELFVTPGQPPYVDRTKSNLGATDSSKNTAPPPYHGHHQILTKDEPKPMGACSHKKHASTNLCRTCQSVRRSARHAPLVRRANSAACHQNRRSVPSPSSSLDSLEDAPSIMERLKKEWELGMLSGPSKESTVDGSRTLPYPLATVMNLSQNEDVEHVQPCSTKGQTELKQFSDEMSNLIQSKSGSVERQPSVAPNNEPKKVELIIREDFDKDTNKT